MSTELLLAIIGLLSAPVASWLSTKLTRRKYDTEIAKLRAEAADARAHANNKELENARLGNEIIMQNIVRPLEAQIKSLRADVNKFRRAIEKIPACPHSVECPVSRELLDDEKNGHRNIADE